MAILVRYSSGAGNLRVAFSLKPSTRYRVSVYAGTCSALGSRIAGPFELTTSASGDVKEPFYLSPRQMTRIASSRQRFSVTVGSPRQCGTLPVRPFSCRPTTSQHPWRILVMVSPSVDVTYKAADGTSVLFQASFTPAELDALRTSVMGVSDLVSAWSQGTAAVTVSMVTLGSPLRSLSAGSIGIYASDDQDVRADLRTLAPFGSYDLVLHVWKSWNESGGRVPAYTWSAGKPSIWTAGASLTSVAVLGTGVPVPAEEVLRIWLDRAAVYYGGFGYGPIPDIDTLGNGAYAPDATGSLAAYYSDFMIGHVHDPTGAVLGGVTHSMWASGTPSTRPFSCVAFC